jgi:lactosylceramide 4-alpha-galactosyltransferase
MLHFHLIWNDPEALLAQDKCMPDAHIQARNYTCLESIFFHHPDAQVQLYSHTLPEAYIQPFVEAGYALSIVRFDLEALAQDTPAEGHITSLHTWSKEPYWVVNLSDLLRLLILYRHGGIYLDFHDTLVLKKLDDLRNAIGWEHHGFVGTGVMIFEKGHPFLKSCLELYFARYEANVWGHQGPLLCKTVLMDHTLCPDFDLPIAAFYPVYWRKVALLYVSGNAARQLREELIPYIAENTWVFHYYGTSQEVSRQAIARDSVLGSFYYRYRIFDVQS